MHRVSQQRLGRGIGFVGLGQNLAFGVKKCHHRTQRRAQPACDHLKNELVSRPGLETEKVDVARSIDGAEKR